MDASNLIALSDSQLIANQVASEYQIKEAILIKYLNKVHNLAKHFKFFQILYVPREHNA